VVTIFSGQLIGPTFKDNCGNPRTAKTNRQDAGILDVNELRYKYNNGVT
jgi:hypothetical protein